MALFPTCRLTIADVEGELNRTLDGSPSTGELAVVFALDGHRFDEARERLARDEGIRTDFRVIAERRLLQATGGETKAWTIHLHAALWDEYARLGRIANISVSQSLVAAIQRDAARRRSADDTIATLDENVRKYQRLAAQVLEQGRTVVERLGTIHDLASRLSRIERAVASISGSR